MQSPTSTVSFSIDKYYFDSDERDVTVVPPCERDDVDLNESQDFGEIIKGIEMFLKNKNIDQIDGDQPNEIDIHVNEEALLETALYE
jgi:hypothetical protein